MGKFDGLLLVSDYDNTLGIGETIHPDNLAMLDWFMSQGGRFTMATGRAIHTFRHIRDRIPFNAPVLLSNGAQIYDFQREELLSESLLPPTVAQDMAQLARLRPEMSLEAYRGETDIYVWNPNPVVEDHLAHVNCTAHFCPIDRIPLPWGKTILEHDRPTLLSLQAELLNRWGDRYEAAFSAETMLELNAKGCTKGTGALRLASLLGIRRENIYCVGDNENDIPMLRVSAIPFAPENAIPAVKDVPGVVVLPRCEDGAVAALIRRLDAIY